MHANEHKYYFYDFCLFVVYYLFFPGLSGLGRGFEISFAKNTDFMHPFAAGSLYLFCAIH